MALVDRAELERALEQLRAACTEDACVKAATDTIERALHSADKRRLLTTAEAADALGVRSVNTIKYWVKTGYLQGVKRNERTMIPAAEIERIIDDDPVRQMRAAEELDELTNELGLDRPMTDEEMQALEATRPGTLPWKR